MPAEVSSKAGRMLAQEQHEREHEAQEAVVAADAERKRVRRERLKQRRKQMRDAAAEERERSAASVTDASGEVSASAGGEGGVDEELPAHVLAAVAAQREEANRPRKRVRGRGGAATESKALADALLRHAAGNVFVSHLPERATASAADSAIMALTSSGEDVTSSVDAFLAAQEGLVHGRRVGTGRALGSKHRGPARRFGPGTGW
eukprot:g2053.t1